MRIEPETAGQILNLRRAGVTFDVIADRLNLTPPMARTLFDKALAEADPEFQRTLEIDRLDRLHAAVWPRALKGELDAVDRVVKLSERREKVSASAKVNDHALRDAFDRSAGTSTDLNRDVDAGLLEAGRKIADRVDEAVATGEGLEVTKALYLVPHMVNVLREMLATPASRAHTKNVAPAAPASAPEGKLAKLRAIQGAGESRSG